VKEIFMHNKYIIAFFFLLLSGYSAVAQNNTNSPYSMFGIGNIETGGFGRNKALGGAGIALPSEMTLNNINPASYHSIDSLYVILETGLNSVYSQFANGSQKQENLNFNFSYLALGFRITRHWASSIGISPYSNVGYSINTQKQIEGTLDNATMTVTGSGGLNQFYWGNSLKLNKNFSLGVNASYLFGSISQTEKTTLPSMSGSMNVEDDSRLKNLYFNYGMQYSFKVNSNFQGIFGAVYGNKTNLNLKHQISILDFNSDTISKNLPQNSTFKIPQYYGFGASVRLYNKLVVTSDYTRHNWAGANPNQSAVEFVNSDNYALGIEIIPSLKPSATYLQMVRYRLGAYKEDSYIKIRGQQLTDMGISAGMGFPILKGKMYLNFAAAIGRKGGSQNSGIISENYYRFNLNFSLIDFWFNRAKFD
jgi:hypothetical protein